MKVTITLQLVVESSCDCAAEKIIKEGGDLSSIGSEFVAEIAPCAKVKKATVAVEVGK